MKKKWLYVLTAAMAVISLLAACERSAVAPETQATPTGGSVGLPTTVDAYKTQTIAAAHTALALTMQPGAPSTFGTPAAATPTGGYWSTAVTPTSDLPIPTYGTPVPTVPSFYAPTPTPGLPTTYTLQQGEHPYCIARRFNIDPDELLQVNNLVDGELFQPGLMLTIPATGHTFPGTRALRTHPATYVVALNDTIYRIACSFGDVEPIYLAAYNGIVAPYTLTTGSVLSIP